MATPLVPPFPPVLFNVLAAGLFLGLIVFLGVRRPPRRLALPLFAFNAFILLYILGDAITLTDSTMFWEQVGIGILYSGSLPASAACWVLAVRYAEAQGMPLRRFGPVAERVAMALAAVAWLAVVTNPWHQRVLVPVIGANNVHLAGWYPVMGVGYVLTWGSVALLAGLAWRATDCRTRRNALLMAIGLGVTPVFSCLSYRWHEVIHWDLTVVGLCTTAVVFLFGAYRTRLFSLLPVAHREIFRHDPDAVLVAGAEGWLLQMNPAAQQLLGMGAETAAGDVFALLARHLRDPEGLALDGLTLRGLLQHTPPTGQGVLLRTAAAPERWLRLSAIAVPPERDPPAAVCLRLLDVSAEERVSRELRRARDELEQRVRERTEELRISEERYRLVSELSSDLSFALRVTPDGRIDPEWFAGATGRLTGYHPEDLEGAGWLQTLAEPEAEQMHRVLAEFGTGEVERELEIPMRSRWGERRWISVRVAAIDHLADGGLRFVGAARDVTDRHRAEEERRLLEVRTAEAQRLESLGVLAGGIAHDFNNLLAVVLGQGALALRELEDGSPIRHRVERITAAARYAAQLTDQMLTYAGRATPKRSTLDLSELLEGIRDLLLASVSTRCRLEMELEGDLPPVLVDASQLQQVVMNLVTNAGESASEGPCTVRVRTARAWMDSSELAGAVGGGQFATGEYVMLEVADDGPGMDEPTRRHIFEPFFTTKHAGRGLGLGVVLGIVRAHGGAILLDSEPGRGTRFRIFLPRGPATTGAGPLDPAASHALLRAGSVLVVDDDEAVLEVACHVLERAGFHVTAALGGREALDHIEAGAAGFDAVVLDLSMPDVDGGEVLRALRQRSAALPVVLLSGFNEEVAAERVGETGVHTVFLRKPYEPSSLVAALGRLMDEAPRPVSH